MFKISVSWRRETCRKYKCWLCQSLFRSIVKGLLSRETDNCKITHTHTHTHIYIYIYIYIYILNCFVATIILISLEKKGFEASQNGGKSNTVSRAWTAVCHLIFWWLRSSNLVKFTEVCVMCIKNHVLLKNVYKCVCHFGLSKKQSIERKLTEQK